MSYIKIPDGLCVKCDDGKLKPCIGKREKALCVTHYREAHKRSPKGKKDDVIYQDLKKDFLNENPYCQIMIEGICTNIAVDIHHDEGHIGHYLDISTYKAACRPCHSFIGDHPTLAYGEGHSKKRLTTKE